MKFKNFIKSITDKDTEEQSLNGDSEKETQDSEGSETSTVGTSEAEEFEENDFSLEETLKNYEQNELDEQDDVQPDEAMAKSESFLKGLSSNKDNNSLSDSKDDELVRAIEELMLEDSQTELEDIDYEFIKDVSVYDTMRKDKDEVLQELQEELEEEGISSKIEGELSEEELAENQKKEKRMFLIFYSAVGGLTALILILGCTLLFISNSYANKVRQMNRKEPNISIVSQTDFSGNRSNYIYLSKQEALGNEKIILSKMLADSTSTIFYFDNELDLSEYRFTLSDEKGRIYARDLYYLNDVSAKKSKQTIVRFLPVFEGSRRIKLNMSNSDGDKTNFYVEFENGLTKTPARYIKSGTTLDADGFSVKLNNLVFSGSATTVEYGIATQPNKEYIVTQGRKKNSEYVTLSEAGKTVTKINPVPASYRFDNMSLNRIDFEPLKNLSSSNTIRITDIFRKYDVNFDVNAANISDGRSELSFTKEIDNYKIVFEGLVDFGSIYTFVFHGENKNIPFDASDPLKNRIEVIVDAVLKIRTPSGMDIIFDGECKAKQVGTDMVFNIDEDAKAFLNGISRSNIDVEIKSIYIKEDDVKFNISGKDMGKNLSKERIDFEKQVVTSFEERLKYKSRERTTLGKTIFSEKVLSDDILMSNYEPNLMSDSSTYSVQIVTADVTDTTACAVVLESWLGESETQEIVFNRTHKIKAVKLADKSDWIINYDEIIK